MPRPATAPDPLWRTKAREFVPVGEGAAQSPTLPVSTVSTGSTMPGQALDVPLPAIDAPEAWETRVSLFGDLER